MTSMEATGTLPSLPSAPRRRRRWLTGLLFLPFLLLWIWCFLLEPDVRTALAPILGPWSGLAFGHHDCTMANSLPRTTWFAVGLGVVALSALALARRPLARLLAGVTAGLWALLWMGLAALSILNLQS